MYTLRWVYSTIIKNGYMYCISGKLCTIYKISIQDFSIKAIKELYDGCAKYWNLIDINNYIYCIASDNQVLVISDYSFENVNIFKFWGDIPYGYGSVEYGGRIILIPSDISEDLYYFSIYDHKVQKDIYWKEYVRRMEIRGTVGRIYQEAENVYFLVRNYGYILKYDLLSHSFTMLKFPLEISLADFISYGDKYYVLSDENKKVVYCWDTLDDSIIRIYGEGDGKYSKLVKLDQFILIDAEDHIELLKNNTIFPTDFLINKGRARSAFLQAIAYHNLWILLPWGNKDFVIFPKDFGYCMRKKVHIPFSKNILFDAVLEDDVSLGEYLDQVSKMDEHRGNNLKENVYGSIIYKNMI